MGRPTRRFHLPSAARPSTARIDSARALELSAAGALVVDVRRHDDATASLAGALRIPPDEIPRRAETFGKDVVIVLGCT